MNNSMDRKVMKRGVSRMVEGEVGGVPCPLHLLGVMIA